MGLSSEKLFHKLTEVCKHFDIPPSTLRYWESEFPSFNPKRNEKGTRFYNQKDIEEISKIHLLVKQNKYTIQGAIEKLKMDKKKIDENVKIVQKLKKIRDFLTQLKQEL
jgi:DNA-binding transcriptional MerR regulator